MSNDLSFILLFEKTLPICIVLLPAYLFTCSTKHNLSQSKRTYSKYVLSSLPTLNVLSHYCLCHELHKKFSKPMGQEMNGWDPASFLPTSVSFM